MLKLNLYFTYKKKKKTILVEVNNANGIHNPEPHCKQTQTQAKTKF